MSADPLIGRLIGGRYRVVRPLAAGGMGAVYNAVQESLQREVAIKVIRAGNVDEQFRLRFEAEALLTSRLQDPHVVTVHDFGIDDDLPFLVLEQLAGRDLSSELALRGRLPWRRAVRVLRGVAAALVAAARVGVVHRDLKPSNIFLVDNPAHPDFVKVLDFGIAKLLTTDKALAETDAGSVVGTPGYVAPERLLGAPDDPRSDLYALGVIAWDVLAGRPPFVDTLPLQLALRHLQEPAPRLRLFVDVPPALDALIDRLLQKTADARPSAAEVVGLLDAIEAIPRGPNDDDVAGAPLLLWPAVPTESSSKIALPLPPPSSLITAAAPSSSSSSSSKKKKKKQAAVVVVVAITLLLSVLALRPPAGPQTAHAATFRRLTWEAGVEREPALSPDGAIVAFVAPGAGGGDDLWLQALAGGAATNLSQTEGAIESDPTFSSDGQQLAWSVHADGVDALWIGGPRGEGARRVAVGAVQPAFAPDGSALLFGSVGFEEPEGVSADGRAQLRSVDVVTGKTRVVADALPSFQPAVSARGRVAFWAFDGAGRRDLFTTTSAGGIAVAVTADAAVDFSPCWSDDGASLFFLSNRSGTMSLWAVAVDDDSGAAGGEPVPVLPGAVAMRAASVAAGRVVYRAGTTVTVLQRRAFDVDDDRVGAPVTVLETARELKSIDASPDGRWLVAEVLGEHSDVLLIAADGSSQRLLTNDAAADRSPRFVDDGRVVFASNRGGVYGLWLIDVDGGAVRALPAAPCPTVAPLPSPDGTRIVASQLDCGGRLALYELAALAAAPTQLPLTAGPTLLPMAWRDSDTLIVNRVGQGYDVVDVGADGVVVVVSSSPLVLGAAAVPDERRLIALLGRMLVVIDSDEPRPLLHGGGGLPRPFVVDGTDPAFALARDGRALWISTRSDQSDLWVAELDGR